MKSPEGSCPLPSGVTVIAEALWHAIKTAVRPINPAAAATRFTPALDLAWMSRPFNLLAVLIGKAVAFILFIFPFFAGAQRLFCRAAELS